MSVWNHSTVKTMKRKDAAEMTLKRDPLLEAATPPPRRYRLLATPRRVILQNISFLCLVRQNTLSPNEGYPRVTRPPGCRCARIA